MKKRLKIREAQFDVIRNLREKEAEISRGHSIEEIKADYNKLEEYINNQMQQMDRYYNLITMNSIQEIFTNEELSVNIRRISSEIDKAEDNMRKLYAILYDKVEEMPEEAVLDWGDGIRNDADTIKSKLERKKYALEGLINLINNIRTNYSDNIGKWFGKIQPDIEI